MGSEMYMRMILSQDDIITWFGVAVVYIDEYGLFEVPFQTGVVSSALIAAEKS